MTVELELPALHGNDALEAALRAAIPTQIACLPRTQQLIPHLARDGAVLNDIAAAVQRLPSSHTLIQHDARDLISAVQQPVELVLTSPPYWNLKRYRDSNAQLGHIDDFAAFITELDRVWRQCFDLLVPGGRLVCVVGDVCLSRRQNAGRHTVVPLHSAIQLRCVDMGFDNLAPIIWSKIANASYESAGPGGVLGKPFEPNAVIKNDVEYILMFRKPGGYRSPSWARKLLSVIGTDEYRQWFRQVWTDVPGAATGEHPAPYPLELAMRLIKMFSFAGDTVLDPFMGTGTTNVAAAKLGRSSIGLDIEPAYVKMAAERMRSEAADLFRSIKIETGNV